MNEQLKKLIDLQKIDLKIDEHLQSLNLLPQEIQTKRFQIQECLVHLEEEKKKLIDFQLKKKEKELEVGSCDEKISKNEKELNSIKSNDTYKMMLTEISNTKQSKADLEDIILTIMLEMDQVSAHLKTFEQETKQQQQQIQQEIKQIEDQIQKTKELQSSEENERASFILQVPSDLLMSYEYIRKKKSGSVLAEIRGDICMGCNTTLTQLVLLETKKGKDLIICESCSRILYLTETLNPIAPASAPSPTL